MRNEYDTGAVPRAWQVCRGSGPGVSDAVSHTQSSTKLQKAPQSSTKAAHTPHPLAKHEFHQDMAVLFGRSNPEPSASFPFRGSLGCLTGDNLAEYFTVFWGVSSLSACQAFSSL